VAYIFQQDELPNKIPHTIVSGSGEFAEILNDHWAGARGRGHEIEASPDANMHQLICLHEAEGMITRDW
jgi:hypothetical protein